MDNLKISSNSISAKTCQYLGLWDEPSGFLSYPSSGNRCFHCLVPTSPLLSHQEVFCLGGSQNACPVYRQTELQPFPPSLLKAEEGLRKVRARPALFQPVLIMGIIVLVFIVWLFIPKFFVRPLILPSRTPASTLQPSETPLTPTASPFPSETFIPSPTYIPTSHALEVELNVSGKEFLMHRVLGGETFEILAARYNTKPDVIRAINYYLKPSLWANTVIVVSPGLQTVDPLLPAFRAYQVTDKTTTPDDLAAKLSVSAALIKQYNSCTDVCDLVSGDWLIIPYPK